MSCIQFIDKLDHIGCDPLYYESPALDGMLAVSCNSAMLMACRFLHVHVSDDAACVDVASQFVQCKLSDCVSEMLNATVIEDTFEDLCSSLLQDNFSPMKVNVSARKEILSVLFIAIGVFASCLLLDFTCYKFCKHQRRKAQEAARNAEDNSGTCHEEETNKNYPDKNNTSQKNAHVQEHWSHMGHSTKSTVPLDDIMEEGSSQEMRTKADLSSFKVPPTEESSSAWTRDTTTTTEDWIIPIRFEGGNESETKSIKDELNLSTRVEQLRAHQQNIVDWYEIQKSSSSAASIASSAGSVGSFASSSASISRQEEEQQEQKYPHRRHRRHRRSSRRRSRVSPPPPPPCRGEELMSEQQQHRSVTSTFTAKENGSSSPPPSSPEQIETHESNDEYEV